MPLMLRYMGTEGASGSSIGLRSFSEAFRIRTVAGSQYRNHAGNGLIIIIITVVIFFLFLLFAPHTVQPFARILAVSLIVIVVVVVTCTALLLHLGQKVQSRNRRISIEKLLASRKARRESMASIDSIENGLELKGQFNTTEKWLPIDKKNFASLSPSASLQSSASDLSSLQSTSSSLFTISGSINNELPPNYSEALQLT